MKFTKDPLLSKNTSPHSPHNIIPALIKHKSEVLDVGCNTGFLAETLNKKNIITDGIDLNEDALIKAKNYCRNVFRRDLYKNKIDIPPHKYDYIIFADILEHLPRPDLILKDVRNYLKPNGKVIASIPNIARFEIRLKLLFGKFNYEESGIMSKDHLRFFTKESALELFLECGFKVENTLPTGFGHMIKIFPTLTAFQFVYVASKA